MSKKIVVTGIGSLTCLGDNVSDLWESLKNGVSGISYFLLRRLLNFLLYLLTLPLSKIF